MLPRSVLYYGSEDALLPQTELRSGPLKLVYEQGDLRYIRLGDTEILRRIYVAVRDRNWRTIPPILSNVQMQIGEETFRIHFYVDHKQGGIDFGWEGEISGDRQGKIIFTMQGAARSTFWRNRIGFCVLYPASLAGCPAEVEHVDGLIERTTFPDDIVADQPVRPFHDLRSITHEISEGKWAKVEFLGDVFEMEDQRNWTDASFKTFCTPLSLPFPVEIHQGTEISQSITIHLQDNRTELAPAKEPRISYQFPGIEMTVDRSANGLPVPAIGLGLASHDQPLSAIEIERLRELRPAHLRVDLPLYDPRFITRLHQAVHQAQSLGIPLEAAVFVSEDTNRELSNLRAELEILKPQVSAWLCYPQREISQGGSPAIEAVVAACRKYLGDFDPSIPFFAGTNSDLVFLKRNVPPLDKIDGICFALCPQAHAYDHASLVESLEVQGKTVESARRLGKGLPIRISPVTLKMRFNPYATGPVSEPQPGELPPQVDVRQMSLFGAGWTVGSFKSLAEAGTQSITYYETTGWRGVMETEAGSPLPEIFRSLPGAVFPLYHVLSSIAELKEGEIIPLRSSSPLQANGFLLRQGRWERLITANYSTSRKEVQVGPVAGQATIHYLDEDTALSAMSSPEVFRTSRGMQKVMDIKEGFLKFEMPPLAIAIIDLQLNLVQTSPESIQVKGNFS